MSRPLGCATQKEKPRELEMEPRETRPIADVGVSKKLRMAPSTNLLSTRSGPQGKTVTFLSGPAAIQAANNVFEYNGYSVSILKDPWVPAECTKSSNSITYLCKVRVTLLDGSGSFRENIGGDTGYMSGSDHDTMVLNTQKMAVTDAVKRALSLFGPALNAAEAYLPQRTQPEPQSSPGVERRTSTTTTHASAISPCVKQQPVKAKEDELKAVEEACKTAEFTFLSRPTQD